MTQEKLEITDDLLNEMDETVTEIMLEIEQSNDSELINRMFERMESIESEIRSAQRVLKAYIKKS